MKAFWKLLGATLAIGLTPYKVEKNEETGEKSYQALLWRITSAPGESEGQREIGINLGEGTLTGKLADIVEKKGEETHLFSDELCVEYTSTPVTQEEAPEEPAPAEEAAVPAEPAAPAEPGEPAAEEQPVTEENKEEA